MAQMETPLLQSAGDEEDQASAANYGSFGNNQGLSAGKKLDVRTGNDHEARNGDGQAKSTGSQQDNCMKTSQVTSAAEGQNVVIIPANPIVKKVYRAKFRCKCSSTKTSITQGLLNFALLVANTSQMKTVQYGGNSHPYFFLLLVLINFSIILHIVAGALMVYICSNDVNNDQLHEEHDKLNTAIVILVFSHGSGYRSGLNYESSPSNM